MKTIIKHLSRAFNLTFDLVDTINADDLQDLAHSKRQRKLLKGNMLARSNQASMAR